MHEVPYVLPMVGGRSTKHLEGNIDVLGLELSRDKIVELEGAAPFDLGFPHDLMAGSKIRDVSDQKAASDYPENRNLNEPEMVQPIRPRKKVEDLVSNRKGDLG
jgi:hypothetical protein